MANVIMKNVSGVLAVTIQSPEGISAGITIEQEGQKVYPGETEGVDYFIEDAAILPADRDFRNAWNRTGAATVEIDVALAKAIQEARAQQIFNDKYPTSFDIQSNAAQAANDAGTVGTAISKIQAYAPGPSFISNATAHSALDPLLPSI